MKIRKAKLRDVKQLTKLLEHLFAQEKEFASHADKQKAGLRKIIKDKKAGVIFVCIKNKKIIGMTNLLYTISTYLGTRVGIIEDVVFLPKYRNCGYGSKLFSYAIKYADKKGIKRLSLLTDNDNFKAQRFYKKHGFERSSMVQFRKSM